jgi:hypothetical protein
MNRRQAVFAETIRTWLVTRADEDPTHIRDLYDLVSRRHPDMIDTARRNPPYEHALKWHHDVQWALKNLVAEGPPTIRRRPDVGLGWYSTI